MRLVFDAESDGFLEVAKVVWCITTKDIDTGDILSFEPHQIKEALEHLAQSEVLIGHNIIKFDLPLFEKLHGFKYSGELIDTLVVSRLQYPDRPNPKGYTGKAPHSIEAWGYRLGRGKPDHTDWSKYSPEMLHRNVEDVEINHLVYDYLLEEQKK